MLTILKRFSPIVIDAFTYKETYYDFYYPRLIEEFTNDTTQKGFAIPFWSDLAITIEKDNDRCNIKWQFSDVNSHIESHSPLQFQGFVDPNILHHLKIIVPWQLKEKTGVKFALFQPTWALKSNNNFLNMISGISDFKFQSSVNIQVFAKYPKHDEKYELLLSAGTPLYQIVALSDRPIKIIRHLIDEKIYNNKFIADKFSNMYFHRKKLIENKCPFHKP